MNYNRKPQLPLPRKATMRGFGMSKEAPQLLERFNELRNSNTRTKLGYPKVPQLEPRKKYLERRKYSLRTNLHEMEMSFELA